MSKLSILLYFAGIFFRVGAENLALREEGELDILKALFEYTDGQNWIKKHGWNDPQIHYCEWYGITCITAESSSRRRQLVDQVEGSRTVDSINLAENNLKGSVPLSLLLILPNLRSLKLNGNNVDYGQIAQQEQEILGKVLDLPRNVHSNIQHLDLSQTAVRDLDRIFTTGSGTTRIETPLLKTFRASQAQVRASLPAFLFLVTTMETLSLDHNTITGTLPITIGNFRSLKYLSLSGNALSGTLPNTMNQLGKLRYLLLQSNRFTGGIPIGLTSDEYTPLLEQLDLSRQRATGQNDGGLTGRLPAFDTQKQLRRVDLQVNSFSGTIPSSLLSETDFSFFDFIELSSNQLTGTIPQSVLQRIPTSGLFMKNNRITGLQNCPTSSDFGCAAILCPPGTFEPRSGRQEEDARPCLECPQNSNLWGQTVCLLQENNPPPPLLPPPPPPPPTESPNVPSLPSSVATPSPNIPEPEPQPPQTMDELSILRELYDSVGGKSWSTNTGWFESNEAPDASFCTWHGVVCESESKHTVKYLHLDGNNLLGTMPQSIFNLPSLRSLDVSHNEGLAVNLEDIGKSGTLEALDLSTTKVENLNGIVDAANVISELHMNAVKGLSGKPMPMSIFALTNLRQLTLDNNNIEGSFPSDIGNLTQLIIFSARGNDFSGTLPSTFALISNLATLQLASNHLSGTIPSTFARMSTLSILDLSSQWSNGEDDDFSSGGRAGLGGNLLAFEGFSQLRKLDLAVNSFEGSIPPNFLKDVDAENLLELVDISDNFLTGTVPSSISRLGSVSMQNNLITAIDPQVCAALPTDLATFGCDAVLCRPGYFTEKGRQESYDKPCVPCTKPGAAKYFGSTDCISVPTMATEEPAPISVLAPTPERQALEIIYNKCGGEGWTSKKNWMNQQVSVCEWAGIRCSDTEEVTQISFRSNNLVGTFPSQKVFENIPSLERLVLDGNVISFSFDGIGKATNLDTLDLTHTELSSVDGVGNAPKLSNLYLSSNNLGGTISPELLQLTSLARLALAFNDLTGSVPASIANLSNLTFLSLHDNHLTGTIPTQLGKLTQLIFLLIQANGFSGSIPSEINFLRNLGFFSASNQNPLSGGALSGKIPSLATLTSLKKLDLSHNSLSGSVPADFMDSTNDSTFDHMNLSKNKLTGTLPKVLVKFSASKYDFSDNRISGIDETLCAKELGGAVEAYGCDAVLCPPGTFNRQGRRFFDEEKCEECQDNEFFGSTVCHSTKTTAPSQAPLPPSGLSDVEILVKLFDSARGSVWKRKDHWKQTGVSVCSWYGIRCSRDGDEKIEHINLSANNLLGSVPTEIFLLPDLRSLVFESNDVHFSLLGIENARKLTSLDISATNIKNVKSIGKARMLTELRIKQNSLEGSFPTEIFELTSLEQLDFDFNAFTGPLPHSIGKLTKLKLLTGAKNKLTGVLPDQLKNLSNLVTLRLGKNGFVGNIPAGMGEMTSLAYIDLSHQKDRDGTGLSGNLPPFENLRQLRQVRLKANSLSGTIPFNFLKNVNDQVFEYADLSSNKLSGEVPSSVSHLKDIYLQDNQITGISDQFCTPERGPVFSQFGCRAFLCEPGTFNSHGRQESDSIICKTCKAAEYYGTTSCRQFAKPSIPSKERQILESFYRSCGGDDWDENDLWLEPGKTFCNWSGVKCVKGLESVQEINMGANNIVGIPPTELFELPNLESLSLYSNPLGGFNFVGIGNAEKLKELLLDATGVSSLENLDQATSLEKLHLRFNKINGVFPSQIGKLSGLHTLTMAYNQITGRLPPFLEDMTNLRSLLLSNNGIGGDLHGMNFPSSIRRLDLSTNNIGGSIPESFLSLVPFHAKLEVDLSNNDLVGGIPTDLTRFDSMNLYLKGNQISRLDLQLCEKSEWNDGDVGRYGCDGLLCSAGHFAPNGRHSDAGACRRCDNSQNVPMGSVSCGSTSNAGIASPSVLVVILKVVTCAFLCLL